MQPLAIGEVVGGTYRVDAPLTRSPRAHVYVVTHLRFEDVGLVLKVVPPERAADFEADTAALGILTAPSLAHMVDRGVLPDGRPFRVVMRLKGPSLVEALASVSLDEARITEICFQLAALAFEAHKNGIGPLDFSLPNLMFADGPGSTLCLYRVLRPDATPDPASDEAALVDLRKMLERGSEAVMKTGWKPPFAEMRAAAQSEPGARIGTWTVGRTLSESLAASVYEVTDGAVKGVMKLAGPLADQDTFIANGALMKRLVDPRVVRVVDAGVHGGAPFYVMDPITTPSYAELLKSSGPLPMRDTLRVVIDMLQVADVIAKAGGGPTDFSLEHCYRAEGSGVLLTHPTAALTARKRYGLYAQMLPDLAALDVWAAAIAAYELLAGRLPFPITKHSLAKTWLGEPVPLDQRRKDIPASLSVLVNELIAGHVAMSRIALAEELSRIREGQDLAKPAHPHPPPVRKVEPPTVIRPPAPPNPAGPPPLDWRVTVVASTCPISTLTAAAIEGDRIIAFGDREFCRYDAGRWKPPIAAEGIKRVIPWGDGAFLLLDGDGRIQLLEGDRLRSLPVQRPELRFLGGCLYGDKRAYLVGASRAQGRGVLAKLHGEKLTVLAEDSETSALHAAAALADGSVVAVGARGIIVRLRGGAVVEAAQPCAASLNAVAVCGGDLFALGAGAWAFRVTTAPLTANLEPVDTTSTFTVLAADAKGQAWAGTDRGRLLRRRDGHWRQMARAKAEVLAIHPTPQSMMAVCADGAIITGTPA